MKKSILLKIIAVIVMTLMLGTLLTGCGNKISESDVSYASLMLDNVLAGIKDKDYDKFSKDFSGNIKNAITKDKFDTIVATLDSKIGDYKEKSFGGAANTKKDNMALTVVVYKAKYSKETSDVLITISFSDNNGKKMIEGFILNSPNLRKQ
jgi:hypothetical protein